MAKTFAEYAREREARMGPEGREAMRVFNAVYASLTHEEILALATEEGDQS
jgi:hypothetical protein